MCTTTGGVLEWSFTLICRNDKTPTEVTHVILSTGSADDVMSYLIANSVTFNYSSFTLICRNDKTPTEVTHVILSTGSADDVMSYLIANSVTFNYSRISAEDRTPVVSRSVINRSSKQGSEWN